MLVINAVVDYFIILTPSLCIKDSVLVRVG